MSFLLAGVLALLGPGFDDVSPNLPNGVSKSRASTAGLTLALAGNSDVLYAASLNAGIWRSDKGGPWHQLAKSPPCSHSIAVDPRNPRHVAVGERNGFSIDIRLNHCGLWESFDAGESWVYLFDPLVVPGCDSEAVPSVSFDDGSNLYAATSVGIAIKRRGDARPSFWNSPKSAGPVTSISSCGGSTWARTRTVLFRTDDGGRHWLTFGIPTSVGPDRIQFSSRGDAYSLAATPTTVVMPCVLVPGNKDNRNSLIAFDVSANRWFTKTLASGNGTGLGGRRFAKSYPGNLLYGAAQEIHQSQLTASSTPESSTLFDMPVQTNWGGPYGSPPHEIHSDTWDMHLDPNFGKGDSAQAWIACDGGVFASSPVLRDSGLSSSRLFNHRWLPHNDGLHTHHIHTLTALELPNSRQARLAYCTSDNDAFYFDPELGWMNEAELGDVNWTAGDIGNPTLALLVRRSAGFAMLTAFRSGIPKGANFVEDQRITIDDDDAFDGPTSFACIQTLKGEKLAYPLLDAVRLVNLPLKTYDGPGRLAPVPGPLGSAKPSIALIRNRAFAANPDANISKFAGWSVERQELPAGTNAFWVSGGHEHPVYIVFAAGKLYRSDNGSWQQLAGESDGRAFKILAGNQYGPAFLNPFDSRQIYVLATDGVKASSDGGSTFHDGRALTEFLTENGRFPIASGELTGNGRGVILATRANSTATLAHMAFDRSNPRHVVACSPFTGIFESSDGLHWSSLRSRLPKPLSAVVSVSIANGDIYAATEGRGVFRIRR